MNSTFALIEKADPFLIYNFSCNYDMPSLYHEAENQTDLFIYKYKLCETVFANIEYEGDLTEDDINSLCLSEIGDVLLDDPMNVTKDQLMKQFSLFIQDEKLVQLFMKQPRFYIAKGYLYLISPIAITKEGFAINEIKLY